MTQRIVYVDASLLARSSCRLRLYYYQKGYRSKVNNNDTEFGTAFHIFKSEFRRGGEMAFLIGCNKAKLYFRNTPMNVVYKKRYLTEAFLMKVCADYAEKYEKDLFEPIFIPATKHELEEALVLEASLPLTKGPELVIKETKIKELRSDKPLTELKFCIPYYVADDMVIMLVGTIDEVGKWLNGPYCISDTKTTSSWNTESYFQGYELSPQLLFYLFILKVYALEFPNSIFATIHNSTCGAFIDGVFYAPNQPTEFVRSKTFYFSDETLQEYKSLLDPIIESIVYIVRNPDKPKREGIINGSCAGNFKCPFIGVCSMPDEVSRDAILKNNFAIAEYNPLLFQTESSRIIV